MGKAIVTSGLRLVRPEVFGRRQLETVPVGTKPGATTDCLEERCKKRTHLTIFLERTRKGDYQSDKHWNFKGNTEETSKRQSGANTGLPEKRCI